ncbi:hypothetical protein [Streptomyces sp. NPDC053367]|uniref:hypothetical protein n=1 Tax=Streptomyces sp. NPDC053367 TaxID=3365700 RepID=UPI0037D5CE6A
MTTCSTCRQVYIVGEHDCPGRRPLAIGDIVHGHASGAFGRDHYDCVRIEAVGPDWIVARNPHERWHGPVFASGRKRLETCQEARDEGRHDEEPCPFWNDEPTLTTWKPGPA